MDNICIALTREPDRKPRLELWITGEVSQQIIAGARLDHMVSMKPLFNCEVRLVVCDAQAFADKPFPVPPDALFVRVPAAIWSRMENGEAMCVNLPVINVAFRQFQNFDQIQQYVWRQTNPHTLFTDWGSPPSGKLVFPN